jgi:hypothetical protein
MIPNSIKVGYLLIPKNKMGIRWEMEEIPILFLSYFF